MVISKALGFLSKIILTRLLVPEEIGLVIMVIALTGLFEAFAEVGVKQCIIQNPKGDKSDFLNMAWWFQLFRGLGLFVCAFVLTPWFCSFYFQNKPEVLDNHSLQELVLICRTAFLTILFNSVVSPRAHVLHKRFKFGKVVIIDQVSFAIGIIVTIGMACVYRNVWAMIVGLVVGALVRCLLSYILCPFAPTWAFDKESLSQILRFARGMVGLPLLTFAIYNLDVFVIGKMFSAATVGFYGMAVLLAKIPLDLFSKTMAPGLLPVFTEVTDDTVRLQSVLKKMAMFVLGGGVPFVLCGVVFGGRILGLVFGEDYSSMGRVFGLLSMYAILLVIAVVASNVIFAMGRPERHRWCMIIWFMVSSLAIYPSVKIIGIEGAPIALLVGVVSGLIVECVVIYGYVMSRKKVVLALNVETCTS